MSAFSEFCSARGISERTAKIAEAIARTDIDAAWVYAEKGHTRERIEWAAGRMKTWQD